MLGTPIESGGPDVDVVLELLQEYQRTAREPTDLTDQPVGRDSASRARDRSPRARGRALALLEGADADPWCAITWTEADPPVGLARGARHRHQRLATAAAASREDGVLVTMPSPARHGLDLDAAYEPRSIVHSLHPEAEAPYLARHHPVVPSRGDLEGDTLIRSSHRTQQRSRPC
jgi:hypothetical protein